MPLIDLTEARKVIPATGRANDDEYVQVYVDAAIKVIEGIVGEIEIEARTYTAAGGGPIVLPWRPLSITTVTENGTDLAEFVVDHHAGIVYAGTQQTPRSFSAGSVTIVAQVGITEPGANLKLAALEELRFLWQLGQQGPRPAFNQESESAAFVPSGFAVPRRVIELCGSSRRLPGIA